MTRQRGSLENLARRAVRWVRKRSKRSLSHAWLVGLRLSNRVSRASVLGDLPVTVSLTSYGPRVDRVAYTIESIARGRSRPRRLILWLDDPHRFAQRPAALRRLESRGVEIRVCENFGPHTKYFPWVESGEADGPLVTADDDVLYPRGWLARLHVAHVAHPTVVSCYRASRVVVIDGAVAPYDAWPRCTDTVASITRFATGVSGVLYPMAMLDELAARGRAFLELSPRADDIWLHWVALRAGIAVRQVSRTPVHFPTLPGTQGQALVNENVHAGGNDRWIQGLYTSEDVTRLVVAASS